MNGKNRLILSGLLLLSVCSLRAQTGFPRYYEYAGYLAAADSLYHAKQYNAAGSLYARAIRVPVEKGITVPYKDLHFNAACAWGRGGKADSAFYHLGAAADAGFTDRASLAADEDLATLHTDSRWQDLIARVTAAAERKDRLAVIYRERTRFAGDSSETIFQPLNDHVKALLQADSLPFISLNYQNFRIFFKGSAYAATHLSELKPQLTGAFQAVLQALDTSSYRTGINLVLVDSRDEMREVTGIAAYGGMALVGDNTLFLVFNGKRRLQAKHELFHLLSNDAWGPTNSRLLDEGGAVFADNECYCSDPLYGISAWFKANGKLIPFSSLIGDFDNEARKSDVIAYLESGAIFKYLYEKYGIPRLKRLRTEGFGNFEAIYGFPPDRLEDEWNGMISRVKIPDGINWEKLLKEGCS